MITAYKKGQTHSGDPALITLYVDRNSRNNMFRITGNRDTMMAKHRCERCHVGEIINLATGAPCLEAESFNVPDGKARITYRPGEVVKADSYDEDESKVCSGGIHFFLSMDRAITYKSPFYNRLFRVWFDNGMPRFVSQTTDSNHFHGLFVEYNKDGRIIREVVVKHNIVIRCVEYSWKPIVVHNYPSKTVPKMMRKNIYVSPQQRIEEVIPGLKIFL
jgi:hypothetical protein